MTPHSTWPGDDAHRHEAERSKPSRGAERAIEEGAGAGIALSEVDVCGITDRGLVRRSNEDHFLIATVRRMLFIQQTSIAASDDIGSLVEPEALVLGVADGISGYRHGARASACALEAAARYIVERLPRSLAQAPRSTERQIVDLLRQAGHHAQDAVRATAARDQLDPFMGTTLTMAYVTPLKVYTCHAGDSRCYLMRGDRLHRLTTDHTAAQALANQARDSGEPIETPERLHHILVNAIGGGDESLTVDVDARGVVAGDALLLCSDGLIAAVDEEQIANALHSGGAERCCRQLLEAAKRSGAPDNVTVIAAKL